MKKVTLLLTLLLLAAPALAQQGHLKLLAVKETSNGFEGSTADLFLEVKEGEGRVFLDTFPLTKTDTQISTRFAKDVACNFLDKDCSKFDFFYTIKADSPIIAGPSAGAAATFLTVALLEGLPIDEEISITGTINSGGLIGRVGGIKEKIDAAIEAGLTKVLIPEGARHSKEEDMEDLNWTISKGTLIIIKNETDEEENIDLIEYGHDQGIEIKEVSTLNDVIFDFTGEKREEEEKELLLNQEYIEIMKKLASDLCNRTAKLEQTAIANEDGNETISIKNSALNLSQEADINIENENYYSAASRCFGANVKYSYLSLLARNLENETILKLAKVVRKDIARLNTKLDKKEKLTITDLESYSASKERLIEAENYLDMLENKSNDDKLYYLAYASERVYSAYSWFEFFVHIGKKFDLNKEQIKASCNNKIEEAEERYHYVRLFLPGSMEQTREVIDEAYDDLENKDYELCLFKAAKAKAESDTILNLIGVEEDQLNNIVKRKLKIVRQNIIKEINKGVFPIIGYSYFEYATTLLEPDPYSAAIYSEYALELSNLGMYFQKKVEEREVISKIDLRIVGVFIGGLVLGLVIGYAFAVGKRKKKSPKKGRRRRK